MPGPRLQTKIQKLIFKLGHCLDTPDCAPKIPLGKAVKRGKVGNDRPPLDIFGRLMHLSICRLLKNIEVKRESSKKLSASTCK